MQRTHIAILIALAVALCGSAFAQAQPAAQVAPSTQAPSENLILAVEEFRVQTAAQQAVTEGQGGGGGRGGGRGGFAGSGAALAWHGRVVHNFRNDALDAIPHEIVQRNQPQRKLRYNQYGFNVTGPVYLPKVYNGAGKTFFTFQYEGSRQSQGQSGLNTIPTTLERTGSWSHVVDFVGNPLVIYNPATTFANPDYNPAEEVSEDNLQYIRLPFDNNVIPQTQINDVARDALQYYPQPNANAGPFFRNNYFVVSNQNNKSDGFTLTVDHTFLEKHRVTVRTNRSVGVNGSAPTFLTIANPANPDTDVSQRSLRVEHIYTASSTMINTLTVEGSSNTFDRFAPVGPDGKPFPRYEISGYQNMGVNQPVSENARNNYSINDNFSLRTGTHRFTFGMNLGLGEQNVLQPQAPEGQFLFTAGLTSLPGINNTGHGFASFLLGGAALVQRGVVTSQNYFRNLDQGYQFNDQWQVTPSLTLTFSANWNIERPRWEKYDRLSNISLTEINPANGRPGALVVANRDGYSRGFQPVFAKVSPQIGIAWSVLGDNDTVLRINFGRNYGGYPNGGGGGGRGGGFGGGGFGGGGGGGHFGTQAFNGTQTWLSNNQQLEAALNLGDGFASGRTFPDLSPDAANGTQPDFLDVSNRQPTQDTLNIEVQRQLMPFLILTVGYNYQNGRNQRVGNNAANPNAIALESLVFADQLNDLAFANSFRAYPQYQDFSVNGFPIGKNRSNEMRIRLEKRTSGGLALGFDYRYRKQYDNSSQNIQNFFDLTQEWSISSFMREHQFSFNYIYELPFGPGKRFLNSTGWVTQFLGGWAITGTGDINSGQPLTLQAQFNNTGGVVNSLRADVVPGVDPRVEDQGPALWFNPDAFEQPADFTLGNTPRTHPFLRGPGNWNTDLTASKRFALPADKSLEFSATFLNVLNRGNWNQPDTRIGTNVNAGKIIGSQGGRIVNLQLRLNF